MDQNPWAVESLQAFYFLKCPECDFNTKEGNSFENHATENHPLSFVLFDKKYVEEDFDTIDIKEEPLSHSDIQISYQDQKSYTHNQFSPLSYVTEDNSILDVPELKKEPTDECCIVENQSRNNEIDINTSETEPYFTDVSIIGDNQTENPLNSAVHEEKNKNKDLQEPGKNEGIDFLTESNFDHGSDEVETIVQTDAEKTSKTRKIQKKLRCDRCNASFLGKQALIYHIDKAHFNCDYCKKTFKRKSQLLRHTNHVHLKLQPHMCSECEKAFSVKENLTRHVELVHLKKKPFKCQYCKYSFGYKQGLKKHIIDIHQSLICRRKDKTKK